MRRWSDEKKSHGSSGSGAMCIIVYSGSMVWSYLQDVAFNMVMLTVMIFTSNAVVKEMFGL